MSIFTGGALDYLKLKIRTDDSDAIYGDFYSYLDIENTSNTNIYVKSMTIRIYKSGGGYIDKTIENTTFSPGLTTNFFTDNASGRYDLWKSAEKLSPIIQFR